MCLNKIVYEFVANLLYYEKLLLDLILYIVILGIIISKKDEHVDYTITKLVLKLKKYLF